MDYKYSCPIRDIITDQTKKKKKGKNCDNAMLPLKGKFGYS